MHCHFELIFFNYSKPAPNQQHQTQNVRHISISPSRSAHKSGFTISKSSSSHVSNHVATPYHQHKIRPASNNAPTDNGQSNSNSNSNSNKSDDSDELNEELSEKNKQFSAAESSLNNHNSSPEFIDCIELLNKAEKKVQNRFSPSLSNGKSGAVAMTTTPTSCSKGNSNFELPDKYFRASDHQHVEKSPLTVNNVLNYNKNITNNNNGQSSSNSSSENGLNGGGGGSNKAVMISSSSSFTLSTNSSNLGNSMSATIPTGASSLVSSASSNSSFHSNSNANFMPHNGFASIDNQMMSSHANMSNNIGNSLRKFSSFDQNISEFYANHNELNEFSFNSTLTNRETPYLHSDISGEIFHKMLKTC